MLSGLSWGAASFRPLAKVIRPHMGQQTRKYAQQNNSFKKSRFLHSVTSRAYSTPAQPLATNSFSSMFKKKDSIRCSIRVTMKINPTTPQAVFPSSGTYRPLDDHLNSIPVIQRKQPATAKILRAIAGLQRKPMIVKSYSTESGPKPERRRKKLARWLSSMYGGDASDDALEKSTQAVNVAMACNLVCFVGKLGAFAYTGSASVFSEALHSLADLANQMLLAMGINRSKRGPSEKHPFGSGNERYVWGLASAVSLFFVGAGASIYHGVSALYDPPSLESLDIALYILLFSAVLEGVSIWVAMEAVRQGAKDNGMTFWQYCLNGPDPMGVAVLMEDGAAMAGLVIAGLCTGLSYVFGTPIFDAVGSIAIGGLLGVAASFLINKNSSALLGQSMPSSKFNTIMEMLRKDNVIVDIKAAKGIMIGADVATFSAEVDFDYKVFVQSYLARYPAHELHAQISTPDDVSALLSDFCNHIFTDLGVQINRIEQEIQALVPEVQFVDIEVN